MIVRRSVLRVAFLLVLIPVGLLEMLLWLLLEDPLLSTLTALGLLALASMMVAVLIRAASGAKLGWPLVAAAATYAIGALGLVRAGLNLPASVSTGPVFHAQLVGAGGYILYAAEILGGFTVAALAWFRRGASARSARVRPG